MGDEARIIKAQSCEHCGGGGGSLGRLKQQIYEGQLYSSTQVFQAGKDSGAELRGHRVGGSTRKETHTYRCGEHKSGVVVVERDDFWS